MKTATKVQDVVRCAESYGGFRRLGHAAIYKLSVPTAYGWLDECDDKPAPTAEHVFVSSVVLCGEPETYAFPCDADGRVLHWCELPGSSKGDVTHEDVLRGLGYEVAS